MKLFVGLGVVLAAGLAGVVTGPAALIGAMALMLIVAGWEAVGMKRTAAAHPRGRKYQNYPLIGLGGCLVPFAVAIVAFMLYVYGLGG
jgi:hypothetical protein